MGLAKEVYRVSESFPKAERFGLTSQIRRAAVSIPSNIAEGSGRKGTREFMHFIGIAHGSLSELETQLILAINLNFTSKEGADCILKDIAALDKMLHSFYYSLKKSQ